jgi:hypothetical protein
MSQMQLPRPDESAQGGGIYGDPCANGQQQHQQVEQQAAAGASATSPPDGTPGEFGTPPGPNGDGPTPSNAPLCTNDTPPTTEGVVRLLEALFCHKELLRLRFIEAWTAGSQKKSRVDYPEPGLERRGSITTPTRWRAYQSRAERQRTNVFFGVCPRPKEGCERSFHIRMVRCLWVDIDLCTPDEALERCQKADLPRPSIIVMSGNGVHLYWLLAEPYLIDDAGDLRPIVDFWVEARRRDGSIVFKENGAPKKYVRKYIAGQQSRGEPQHIWEYITDEQTGGNSKTKNPEFQALAKLSRKALHVQDVLQGIAKQIGGDHTQDLARLLRLPDTMNRKDQRNGKPPVPCMLVEGDLTRRYPFADFEKFAALSPDRERREKVAAVRLRTGIKLTQVRLAKMSDYINRCSLIAKGRRSEADFALCCYAIRKGYSPDEVWPHVESVGKFAEGGRRYFDLTWGRAEEDVRQRVYERTCQQVGVETGPSPNGVGRQAHSAARVATASHVGTPPPSDRASPPGDGGDGEGRHVAGGLPTILVNDRQLRDITTDALDAIHQANDPPRLFQRGNELCRLEVDPDTDAPSLVLLDDDRLCNYLARVADWVRETLTDGEVRIVNVPPPRAVVRDVSAMPSFPGIPVLRALVQCPTFSQYGELVIQPGYHPGARLLYQPAPGLEVPAVPEHPTQEEVAEARRLLLEEVFGEFPFVDEASKAHAVAAALQPAARPMIDGPTPMTLFDAPMEGTGKTLCVGCITAINTGREPEAISEARNDEEWRKRITAALVESPTFLVLDNLNHVLDSGALAAALTATTWKDRLLGFSRTVTVPNTATWLASGNIPERVCQAEAGSLWVAP